MSALYSVRWRALGAVKGGSSAKRVKASTYSIVRQLSFAVLLQLKSEFIVAQPLNAMISKRGAAPLKHLISPLPGHE